jgi:hypothetical protein
MQNQDSQNSTIPPLIDEKQSIISSVDSISTPTSNVSFPQSLLSILEIRLDQHGQACDINRAHGNPYAERVGSKPLDNRFRKNAKRRGITLRKSDLNDINHDLQAEAEMAGKYVNVYYRVAPCQDGIEIDLGDETHTRVRVTTGKVEVIKQGSETFFYRSASALPMTLPSDTCNINKLYPYLNMHESSKILFIAWLTYTLAHPKLPISKYVILVLQGNQGSGKSSLCKNIILPLIDPSSIGVQMMPTTIKDLAIAVNRKHVVCFDNVRSLSHATADGLCVAATGGTLTSRQLYSDDEQAAIPLHCAIVLNGIHSFIDQSDLAQRCLPIELKQISESDRKSEKQLTQQLNADLPEIMRGLLDLIAAIFTYLPTVEVTNPERMIDFVHWLAAMEKAMNVPEGVYQAEFSDAIHQGQLDSLLDNTLASAVVDFANAEGDWFGTPAQLLHELNHTVDKNTQRDREWPLNPIALSKRLKPLLASLSTQAIYITFTRGKNRIITIKKEGN